jgi:hypothetical protein
MEHLGVFAHLIMRKPCVFSLDFTAQERVKYGI